MTDRLVLVGEAPNASKPELDRPGEALTGRIGDRMAALAGVSRYAYMKQTERMNLMPRYEERWDAREAISHALALFERLDGRRVLLLGRRVADAFCRGMPWYSWMHLDGVATGTFDGFDAAAMPHPSSRNRYWNDPDNVADAAAFFRKALREDHA